MARAARATSPKMPAARPTCRGVPRNGRCRRTSTRGRVCSSVPPESPATSSGRGCRVNDVGGVAQSPYGDRQSDRRQAAGDQKGQAPTAEGEKPARDHHARGHSRGIRRRGKTPSLTPGCRRKALGNQGKARGVGPAGAEPRKSVEDGAGEKIRGKGREGKSAEACRDAAPQISALCSEPVAQEANGEQGRSGTKMPGGLNDAGTSCTHVPVVLRRGRAAE